MDELAELKDRVNRAEEVISKLLVGARKAMHDKRALFGLEYLEGHADGLEVALRTLTEPFFFAYACEPSDKPVSWQDWRRCGNPKCCPD